MASPRLSRRGESPTQLEIELVAHVDTSRITEARQIWVSIAQRIGLAALYVILDELGGEKIHVPSRDLFAANLLREQRDAQIRDLLSRGHRMSEVARLMGCSKQSVSRAVRKSDDADQPPRYTARHES